METEVETVRCFEVYGHYPDDLTIKPGITAYRIQGQFLAGAQRCHLPVLTSDENIVFTTGEGEHFIEKAGVQRRMSCTHSYHLVRPEETDPEITSEEENCALVSTLIHHFKACAHPETEDKVKVLQAGGEEECVGVGLIFALLKPIGKLLAEDDEGRRFSIVWDGEELTIQDEPIPN